MGGYVLVDIPVILISPLCFLREGIRSLLAKTSDIRVIAEHRSWPINDMLISGESKGPFVILIDSQALAISSQHGHVTRIAKRPWLNNINRVIVLTHFSWERWSGHEFAYDGSISGFVQLTACDTALVGAIRAAAMGQPYFHLPDAIVRSGDTPYLPKVAAKDGLTSREREVLAVIASGATVKEAAQRLCVSPRTVQTHLGNIMGKTGCRNRADLVRFAMRQGFLAI